MSVIQAEAQVKYYQPSLPTYPDQSTFAPENLTTFAHFSVSWIMNLLNSSGVPGDAVTARSAYRALMPGLASPALIASFSFSMMSDGVPFGAPIPPHVTTS